MRVVPGLQTVHGTLSGVKPEDAVSDLRGVSILHIITRLDRGGSAGVVLDLAARLRKLGARVGIAAGPTTDPDEDLDAYAARTGVLILPVPNLVREVSPAADIRTFFALRREIRRFCPDIVHTHTSKAGIAGRFAAASLGIRNVVHTPHGHVFYGYFSPAKTRLFIAAERAAAHLTRRIVTLTGRGRDDHLREGIGVPEQYRVIPSGIDTARYARADGSGVRAETGFTGGAVVGWAGRLVPVKDCATFLRAAAIIARSREDAGFLIAGDGEERGMLSALAGELGIASRVRFLGDRRDMPEVMAAMDVFVLSSRNEGFGRVIVEAMAAGVPVAATGVGGAVEVLDGGRAGLLVPPGDDGALAAAVLQVLGDAKVRAELSANGRLRAAEFDMGKTVEAYADIYRELLGK